MQTRSRIGYRHISSLPPTQSSRLLYHTGKLMHLSLSITARSKIGKSIDCSGLLVTDNQNHRLFEQEDTLEIIQCGLFPNIFSNEILFS